MSDATLALSLFAFSVCCLGLAVLVGRGGALKKSDAEQAHEDAVQGGAPREVADARAEAAAARQRSADRVRGRIIGYWPEKGPGNPHPCGHALVHAASPEDALALLLDAVGEPD